MGWLKNLLGKDEGKGSGGSGASKAGKAPSASRPPSGLAPRVSASGGSAAPAGFTPGGSAPSSGTPGLKAVHQKIEGVHERVAARFARLSMTPDPLSAPAAGLPPEESAARAQARPAALAHYSPGPKMVLERGWSLRHAGRPEEKGEAKPSPLNEAEPGSPGSPSSPRSPRSPRRVREREHVLVARTGIYPVEYGHRVTQDATCIHEHLPGHPEVALYGVFDGHGPAGHFVSTCAARRLPEFLAESRRLDSDPRSALRQAIARLDDELPRLGIEVTDSGSTACLAFFRKDRLLVANVGDSRAVLGRKPKPGEKIVEISLYHEDAAKEEGKGAQGDAKAEAGGEGAPPAAAAAAAAAASPPPSASSPHEIVGEDLSLDHTPYRRDEYDRIIASGGRIVTIERLREDAQALSEPFITEEQFEGQDPPRVWTSQGLYPGTAFTRSLGDRSARDAGVICEPEFTVRTIRDDDLFVIVASDGIWEFISSQEAAEIVWKHHNDRQEAVKTLVDESIRRWMEKEGRTDDIACIVIWLD